MSSEGSFMKKMPEGGLQFQKPDSKSRELTPEQEKVFQQLRKQVDRELGVLDIEGAAEEIEIEQELSGNVHQIEGADFQGEQGKSPINIETGQKEARKKKENHLRGTGKKTLIILTACAISAGSAGCVATVKDCIGKTVGHTAGHIIHDPVVSVTRDFDRNLRERGKMERTRQALVKQAIEEYNKRVVMANGNPSELRKAEWEYRLKLQAIEEQYGK